MTQTHSSAFSAQRCLLTWHKVLPASCFSPVYKTILRYLATAILKPRECDCSILPHFNNLPPNESYSMFLLNSCRLTAKHHSFPLCGPGAGMKLLIWSFLVFTDILAHWCVTHVKATSKTNWCQACVRILYQSCGKGRGSWTSQLKLFFSWERHLWGRKGVQLKDMRLSVTWVGNLNSSGVLDFIKIYQKIAQAVYRECYLLPRTFWNGLVITSDPKFCPSSDLVLLLTPGRYVFRKCNF